MDRIYELTKAFQKLLIKVNKVTSNHRHGTPVLSSDLDNLSNEQITAEAAFEAMVTDTQVVESQSAYAVKDVYDAWQCYKAERKSNECCKARLKGLIDAAEDFAFEPCRVTHEELKAAIREAMEECC